MAILRVLGVEDSRGRGEEKNGSNCELETQMLLSGDLDYLDNTTVEGIKDEIHEIDAKGID